MKNRYLTVHDKQPQRVTLCNIQIIMMMMMIIIIFGAKSFFQNCLDYFVSYKYFKHFYHQLAPF